MAATRTVLFAGGDPGTLSYLRALDYRDAFLVAVDRGLALMRELGLTPDAFVGDADSVPADLLTRLDAKRTHIVRLPSHKDVSDLEAAFDFLTAGGRMGAVLVLAGLGGRLDHSLFNLQLAVRHMVDFEEIVFEDSRCRAKPLAGANTMRFAPGATVSFVPMTGEVELTLTGFEYPLTHALIPSGSTRTLSNIAQSGTQQVIVDHGTVMMIAWNELQAIP